MDGFNEKKWFVYVGDHHEGPFSLADIHGKMVEGPVNASSYVWCEGMGDWKMMSEVPAFGGLASPLVDGTGSISLNGTGGGASREPAPSPIAPSNPVPSPAPTVMTPPVSLEDKTDEMEPASLQKAEREVSQKIQLADIQPRKAKDPVAAGASKERSQGGRIVSRVIRLMLLLAVPVGIPALYLGGYLDPLLKQPAIKAALQAAGDAARPHLLSLVEKYPAIGQLISPIPRLEDVSAEEFDELKAVAATSLAETGPRVALALGRSDLLMPYFYVSSNLPDGAGFDIHVEGIGDTLLNHTSFTAQVGALLEGRVGKSRQVRFPDGKPLPRGEYLVHVVESGQQPETIRALLVGAPAAAAKPPLPALIPPGRKLYLKKTYFLGGNKDSNYAMRLKEFHDRIKAKASAELSEIKQFAATLDSQLGLSISAFQRSRGKSGRIPKAKMKSWNDFHARWMQLEAQLALNFQKWTTEALEKDYFHGSLYLLVQQISQNVSKVHGIHHAYFTGGTDPQAFDAQLGEAVAQARRAVAGLKARIDQVEKTPPSPKGLPHKEGL